MNACIIIIIIIYSAFVDRKPWERFEKGVICEDLGALAITTPLHICNLYRIRYGTEKSAVWTTVNPLNFLMGRLKTAATDYYTAIW